MTDCQAAFAGLLQSTDLAQKLLQNADQLSAFSNTSTEHSSPPYSTTASEQMQSLTPEHYTDGRTETPSSDPSDPRDFAPQGSGFSPDAATGSDRDVSPDTMSTGSGTATDLKTPEMNIEEGELQRQILRLQGFGDDMEDVKPSLNPLFAAFANNPLLKEKLDINTGHNFSGNCAETVDSFSTASHEKPLQGAEMDQQLQNQILGLNGLHEDADVKPVMNPFLAAFANNPLFAEKFGFLGDKLMTPPMSLPQPPTPQAPPPAAPPTKRKRQRRNPVWPYFDVIDGTARCKQCLYSTKSVFSTNLKVHLRSHHRADYEKVIQAEDALNLNALLMNGNNGKLFSTDLTRKRMPPMTSSILMTINKLANQNGNEDSPLNSVLRQTLAAGSLQQQLQAVQNQIQQQLHQQQPQPTSNAQPSTLSAPHTPAPQGEAPQSQAQTPQTPTQQQPKFPLNAANLAALNQMARNNMMTQGNGSSPMTPEQFMSQFNFTQNMKPMMSNPLMNAPHGTDANGMPQPKRRRLRRHPVWMFFRDLEDRMVGCINCNFRTGSAFSTNLKMHLKAHHKEDYERVLKLEDDMRVQEGVFGPPNKIKSELIDFIREGGNASTPSPNTGLSYNGLGAPKPSPLVQQIISQTLANRQQTPPKNGSGEDDAFSGMSMQDKLAALVGLVPPPGGVEGEIKDEQQQQQQQHEQQHQQQQDPQQWSAPCSAEDLSNVDVESNDQLPPPQPTIVHLNGSVVVPSSQSVSDQKTCSSSSTDGGLDDMKLLRDRALARYWLEQGGNDALLQSENFKALLTSQSRDVIQKEDESSNVEDQSTSYENQTTNGEQQTTSISTSNSIATLDMGNLSYYSLLSGLVAFQNQLGLNEVSAYTLFAGLLRSSASSVQDSQMSDVIADILDRIVEIRTNDVGDRSQKSRLVRQEKLKLKRLFEVDTQRKTGTGSVEPFSVAVEHSIKEERAKRLREYQRKRLEQETPEQRERRLSRMRINQRMRRERQKQIDLIRTLAPDYEMPESDVLAGILEADGSLATAGM